MKRFINSISVELKKTLFSYGTILCIIVTFLLCFTSCIFTDAGTGKEYSVLEVMANMDLFREDQFTSISILRYSLSPYITNFIPVLSSIPFVTAFCAERLGGNMRFVITRSRKNAYYFSKFLSALISGGAAVMLGFILYSIVIFCKFSNADASVSEFIKICIGMGVYGMVSVLPAFFLSSFIKNKYMICCFPFILMHFYYTTISRIQDLLHLYGKDDIVFKIIFLYPSELTEILFKADTSLIIYYSALTVAAITGFTIIMNRRLDHGQ